MSTLRDKPASRDRGPAAPDDSAPRGARAGRLELAGHACVAISLFCLLAYYGRQVDGFYLDDWLYTHTAEYIGQHLPGALYGDIPFWTRGAQRLYPIVLAPLFGGLDASAAATTGHLLNALLLASSVIPAALLARRLIESPLLRVLAVALAVVLPFLTVSATLLTENLAMPLLVWTVYVIARAADSPTILNQVAALVLVAALTLTRLNLAVAAVALVVTVVAAEIGAAWTARGTLTGGRWVTGLVRRRLPFVLALAVGVAGAIWLAGSGSTLFGTQYENSASSGQLQAILDSRDLVWTTLATYTRSLVVGTFVFPFVLALAAALAAARGAFGRPAALTAIAALSTFAVLLVAVSAITRQQVAEERYAFYFFVPVAIFAALGAEHLRRIPVELVVASAVAIWALDEGAPRPSGLSFHFFDAPAGAFWSRVVEHRLLRFETSWLGWLPGEPTGWVLIAVGLAALVTLALASRIGRLPRRLPVLLVAGGLACCVLAQGLALRYDLRSLLFGVSEARGGLAGEPGHAADRVDWVDDGLPGGASAVTLAPMSTPGSPFGGAEVTQYWNRRIDAVLALRFTPAPVVAAAGYGLVESQAVDGLASWEGPDHDWLASQADDPRAQFAGRTVAAQEAPGRVLTRLAKPIRGIWTTTGLEPDGYLPDQATAVMTVARGPAGDGVRRVALRLRGADGLPGAARWRIAGPARQVLQGRIASAQERTVTLDVPPCPRSRACRPVSWRLTSTGRPGMVALPAFGAPPPPRRVRVQILAARLVRD